MAIVNRSNLVLAGTVLRQAARHSVAGRLVWGAVIVVAATKLAKAHRRKQHDRERRIDELLAMQRRLEKRLAKVDSKRERLDLELKLLLLEEQIRSLRE